MNRTSLLLSALGWSQSRLAKEVGVTQTTIWRLCHGDSEAGPMQLALNHVATKYALPHLVVSPDFLLEPNSPVPLAAALPTRAVQG